MSRPVRVAWIAGPESFSRYARALEPLIVGLMDELVDVVVFCPEGVIRRKPEGGYEIDLTYCKGCGICAEECPRGAISLVRESRAR